MSKDRIYIDNSAKAEAVDLPNYGSVTVTVNGGKVVRVDITETMLYQKKPSK